MKKRFASLPVDLRYGYTVEFCFQGSRLVCEWAPDVPNEKTPLAVLAFYQQARDAFIAARLHRLVGTIGPVTTVLR